MMSDALACVGNVTTFIEAFSTAKTKTASQGDAVS